MFIYHVYGTGTATLVLQPSRPRLFHCRRKRRHPQQCYIETIVQNFRLDEFKTFFRVGRVTVESLIDCIQTACREGITGITERMSSGASPQKPLQHRVLMLLWFMASLDMYASIADRFGMSEITACDAVHQLIEFVHDHLLERLVVWPSAAEQQEIQDLYWKSYPGVTGMIDGTHIMIDQPSDRGFDYYGQNCLP